MNAIQNLMTIERLYICNGDGKVKYFGSVDELIKGVNFVTEHGFNAIGIDYNVPNSLPGSKDILVKYEGEASFKLSNGMNIESVSYKNEILSIANSVKEMLCIA